MMYRSQTALVLRLATLLLSLAACTPLTAEDQQRIEEYRRSQYCCGGGGP
jgi:hypothetical protein